MAAVDPMKSSKLFITGCNKTHSWMLPWFQDNFYKHNPDAELMVFDFDTLYTDLEGWFKKPAVMIHASTLAEKVCWLDTDCEVKGNLDGIFNYVEPNKLTMAIDQPWTTRRPNRGNWYNSGVVAFQGQPLILSEWHRHIVEKLTNEVGDQEVLNWMLGGDTLRELQYIAHMPRLYNTLRIDFIDNTAPKNHKIAHWTGRKGKDKIRELMNG